MQEQLIRAERMSALGFFQYIHPDELTAENLMQKLQAELNREALNPFPPVNLNAHQEIAQWVSTLLFTE